MQNNQLLAHRFFTTITAYPKTIITLAFLIIISTAAFIPTLTIDARSESFLPPDNPALVYRDQVEEVFGLKDPMVIAVVNKGGHQNFLIKTWHDICFLHEVRKINQFKFLLNNI